MKRHLLAISGALSLVASACAAAAGPPSVGDVAPDFSLSSASGTVVSLDDAVAESDALLYFNMAYG